MNQEQRCPTKSPVTGGLVTPKYQSVHNANKGHARGHYSTPHLSVLRTQLYRSPFIQLSEQFWVKSGNSD